MIAGGGGRTGPREGTLARLARERFDLLVVGGGATGAGIARDAALRGLRVGLCERGDFAAETSSHSSKLIHGGLRYLQYGDLRLVFEALAERRILMRTAPHLCRPLEFMFPAYQGLPPSLLTLGLGITLYNTLALWRPPVAGARRLSAADVRALAPGLRSTGLRGAHLYLDCQTDDARLVLETALDAEAAGAAVATGLAVTDLVRDRRGRVSGARVEVRESGERFAIAAGMVVNATGPFSDVFDRGRHNLRPTLGVHLVFAAERVPHGDRATVLRSPRDGRLVFLLPAGARTILGTTDTDWVAPEGTARPPRPGDPIVASASDVAYLLEVANHAFPDAALDAGDVVSTFAGLRPLVAMSNHTASSTSREHDVFIEPDGLLTVVGGKLTTYRRMAVEAVDRAVCYLRDHGHEGAVAPSATADRPLPGGGEAPRSLGSVELAPEVERHLRQSYGARAPDVVRVLTRTDPSLPRIDTEVDLASRIDPELPYLWGEIVWAAHRERVGEVEDVLCRRIPLFRDARDQGLEAAPRAAALVGDVLGWNAVRRARSLAAYRARVTLSRSWRGSVGGSPPLARLRRC